MEKNTISVPLTRLLQGTVIPLGQTMNAGVPVEKHAGFIENRHNTKIDEDILRWKAGAPEGRGGQLFALVKEV